ncbi:MAG: hypothetical protein JWN25_1195 [Verrucomicrobiales bacterium]|nr:hypothetical protein [Verrucomicrobiales bacterium]MDB6129153.1 hypothetical protein [Verrucomicrobiales bacterium]
MKRFSLKVAGLLLFSTSLVSAQSAGKVDFQTTIKPIFEAHCISCHGADKPKGGLSMLSRAALLKGGETGKDLVPGNFRDSLIHSTLLLPADNDAAMPPKGPRLGKEQTDALAAWIAQGAEWPESVTLTQTRKIDFVKDIQPILELNCVVCHQESHVKGGLRLDTKSAAFKGGESGPAIVPMNPGKSLLYTSTIVQNDDDKLMPPKPKGGPLRKESIELLRAWVEQGALWPDDVKLSPKKEGETGPVNDIATVMEIQKLIIANSKVSAEQEMMLYTNVIPGSKVTYAMVPIKGGEFVMGSPDDQPGRKSDEGPQHKVQISPFWMEQCETTWDEFELFMYPEEEKKWKGQIATDASIDKVSDAVSRPTKPYVEMSFGMGKNGFPAISMTQHAANKYCQWLSAKTGHFYRLPTEAEWEYACKAGTTTAYSWGDDPSLAPQYAWFEKNSDSKYQKVGKKLPNPWGLYDMHGNVAEWTLDQYEPNYKKFAAALTMDPWNVATMPYPHSVRGGSWDDDVLKLRSTVRRASGKDWKMQDPQLPKSVWYHTDAQFLGFRIIRPLKVPTLEEMQKYWTSGVEKD